MYNKKFDSPEEVRKFLDSDAFADGFKNWLTELPLSPKIAEGLILLSKRLKNLMETSAPALLKVMSEFKKWNISSEVLSKAGWLPHYTMPFDLIAECGEDEKRIQSVILDYYKDKWKNIRAGIEDRLSDYKIDDEAKATFREALDAHEAGLYRCVCRVLFPEIERVFRAELFDGKIEHIPYEIFINALINGNRSINEFIVDGFYDLSVFGHLTKAVRERNKKERGENAVSESDELIFGIFSGVKNKEHQKCLEENQIPNRHAVIHGLVVYSSQQNSLNAIFMADYIFRIVTPAALSTSVRQ